MINGTAYEYDYGRTPEYVVIESFINRGALERDCRKRFFFKKKQKQ